MPPPGTICRDFEDIARFRCCGTPIHALDADTAAVQLLCRAGSPTAVHLCNAYTLSLAQSSRELAEVLERGDLNLPDGMPLVVLARRLHLELAGRAYGPDVMGAVMDRGRAHGLRHYLCGSTPEVLDALKISVRRRWPGLEIVGTWSPPFRQPTMDEEMEMVDDIRAAAPHFVWVGLGTPNQDLFVDRHRDTMATTLVAVGAAFDYLAGTKRQAPRFLQRAGLEWAFRLAIEPRRLARRYIVGNSKFILANFRKPPKLEDGPPPLERADR